MSVLRHLGLGPRIPRERPLPSGYKMLRRARFDPDAVALWGFLNSQIGIGASARGYARILKKAVATSMAPTSATFIPTVRCHAMSLPGRDDIAFPCDPLNRISGRNIVVANPPELLAGNLFFPSDLMKQTYVIGYWAWELPKVPREWLAAFDLVDEVWTCSTYSARAFRQETGKRVNILPHAMEDWSHTDQGAARAALGLPREGFMFLTVFDFASGLARKNPLGVIAAFRQVFGDGPLGPHLVVKYHSAARVPDEEAAVLAAAAPCPRIHIIPNVLRQTQMHQLFDAVNCFVSLHRAEGFGLNIAEAMLAGLPVICTGYSGNMDFTRHDNSLLVDWTPMPLHPGAYFGWEGQVWAEPDKDAAITAMRHVLDRPQAVAVLAQNGRTSVRQNLSPAAIANRLAVLLRYSQSRVTHMGLWRRMSTQFWPGQSLDACKRAFPSEHESVPRRPPLF